MAEIEHINIGSQPNDGSGDSLRVAFEKTNSNFLSLDAALGNVQVDVMGATNIGSAGVGIFNGVDNRILQFKRLVAGSGIRLVDQGNEIGVVNTLSLNLTGDPGSFVITSDSSGSLAVTGVLRYDQLNDVLLTLADVDAGFNKITNLSNPSDSQDAATKAYVDGVIGAAGGGVTVLKNSDSFGLQSRLNFVGTGIDIQQTGSNTVSIGFNGGTDADQVRDIVGAMFTNNLDEGISTSYSPQAEKVNIRVEGFDIELTGAITGSTTVDTFKNNIIIDTAANFISGITAKKDNSILGSSNSVESLNFVGNNVILSRIGNEVTVQVAEGLTEAAVRDEIGTTVKGVISDPSNPSIETESGITTRFVAANNTLELGVRDFNISLVGAVTGSAAVSRLRDVTINTTSNFIQGLTLRKDSSQVGLTNSVTTLNFVGENISVVRDGGVANISVSSPVTGDQVSSVLNPRMLGLQDGLSITFDSLNKFYKYRLNPITINLTGAVAGTGTVTFDGSAVDGNVTINTSGVAGAVSVADEGQVQGQASVINFVGGGVTSAVSIDGTVATVFVPNSPAAEPFITAVAGSENVPNSRLLTAGTGVIIVDEGPGGNIIISANNDAILAKSAYALNGVLIAEQFGININSSQYIKPFLENDVANNRINITMFELRDAWYRSSFDAGTIQNNQGPIIDFGTINGSILEVVVDLGSIS